MIAESTESLQVGYAQPIRQDPILFSALSEATLDLEKLVVQHGLPPADRELIWGSTSPPDQVTVLMTEKDHFGSRNASLLARRSRWLNPVARNEMMIRLLLDVRGKLWYQMQESIERKIDAMEREEREHAHSD